MISELGLIRTSPRRFFFSASLRTSKPYPRGGSQGIRALSNQSDRGGVAACLPPRSPVAGNYTRQRKTGICFVMRRGASWARYYRRGAAPRRKSTEIIFTLPKNPSAQSWPISSNCFIRRQIRPPSSHPSSNARFATSNFTFPASKNGPAMRWHSSSQKSCVGIQ